MAEAWISKATGRRKEATARVFLKAGTGQILVNQRDAPEYFKRASLMLVINQAFEVTDTLEKFDVYATVRGGGLSGQAGALKHGISRCLEKADPELRPSLKSAGFLTRDARQVERKKYGQPGARKRFQFSKR